MEEKSCQEKEGLADSSLIHRLSESRFNFKPMLVKQLLADESDDDSDDNRENKALVSDNSDEDSENLDGCQPLSEESTCDLVPSNLVANTDIELRVVTSKKDQDAKMPSVVERFSDVMSVKVTECIGLSKGNNDFSKSIERKSVSNTFRESLKLNDNGDKSNVDKLASGFKRKSCKDSTESEVSTVASQWQSQTNLDKRKSLPVKDQHEPSIKSKYAPDLKRYSHQLNDSQLKSTPPVEINSNAKESQESKIYSSISAGKSNCSNELSDSVSVPTKIPIDPVNSVKCINSHSLSNTTHKVTDTPMKHSHGSARPNPCTSHRNIFQTPQNKLCNELSNNPMQTPATIFSHSLSQKHMAQTPMQNLVSVNRDSMQTPATREGMRTPATVCVQSSSSRVERPKYYSVEGKSARRPLAETMFSAAVQAPQLPRLQETSNESQPSPSVTKDSSSVQVHDNMSEKKPVHSSSLITYETKENKNPNSHEIVKSDSQPVYQPTFKSAENHNNDLPVTQSRHSSASQPESKPKLEYKNVYSSSNSSRSHENYKKYKSRESQSTVHPSVPVQSEQVPSAQFAKQQQGSTYNSRQKIITVQSQQYLVLSVIGQGMSCEVVRAQDLSTMDLRAIKCVNLNKMDKESVQGCLQEICMLEKLKAPCVVHMYTFEIKQPWVHVVMEIGEVDLNRLLKSMLAEKKKIPLSMILYYWTEMLTAVKHIHDNGVIHSDLKPANFLLVRGRLKLIDFGIASSMNPDMTSVLKNCSIGTLNYVSPEALMDVNAGSDSPTQNVKYKISYKSDVWSLGCILYSLVYGVTPFNQIRQQWGKIRAITDPKHKINFPTVSGNEPVPLILIDVMRKCLQREPKARPTVADLLEIPYFHGYISQTTVPKIPSNILLKIKQALTDQEWKEFSDAFAKI